MILEWPKFCEKISIFINVNAITLWPFIICRCKTDKVMLNHESIHLKQQKELLIIFFYLIYIFNWLWNLFKYGNFALAYENIIFEKEAYDNEYDIKYLESRKYYQYWR